MKAQTLSPLTRKSAQLSWLSPMSPMSLVALLAAAWLAVAAMISAPAFAQAPNPEVCDRTTQIRDFLVNSFSEVSVCDDVTLTRLQELTHISLDNIGLTSMESGDLNDLVSLRSLTIEDNPNLETLPDDVFAPFNLRTLLLRNNAMLTTLPTITHMTNLETIDLSGTMITSMSPENARFLDRVATRTLPQRIAPLDLTASGGRGEIHLNWHAPPLARTGETDVPRLSGYRIEVSLDGTNFTTVVANTGGAQPAPTNPPTNPPTTNPPPPTTPPDPVSFGGLARTIETRRFDATSYTHGPVTDSRMRHYRVAAVTYFGSNPGDGEVGPYSSIVTAAIETKRTPTADAGPDLSVPAGTLVTLNGRGSTDPDGDVLTYQWRQTAPGPRAPIGRVELRNANTAEATFIFPGEGNAPELVFELRVTGIDGATSTDEVTVTGDGYRTLNEAILPELARAITGTTRIITSRIDQASGQVGAQFAQLNLGGHSIGNADDLSAAALSALSASPADRNDIKKSVKNALKTTLANSQFALPISHGGGDSQIAWWGGGDYRDIGGENASVDWEGNLTGFHLGIDGHVNADTLLGVAVATLDGDITYNLGGVGEGEYGIEMQTITPYLGWSSGDARVWASFGGGKGDLDILPLGGVAQHNDIEVQSIAFGGENELSRSGETTISVKGEASQATMKIQGNAQISELNLRANQMRVALNAHRQSRIIGGGWFEPSVELSARLDGGDGETGRGIELGGGMRYRHPNQRLTAESNARIVLVHGGDYEEWGVQGSLRMLPNWDFRGLSFHVTPGYGDGTSGVNRLWDDGVIEAIDRNRNADNDYAARLDTRIGYGLSLRDRAGVVTPYSAMTIGTANTYSFGVNWQLPTAAPAMKSNLAQFDINFAGERHQSVNDDTENSVLLKGSVSF